MRIIIGTLVATATLATLTMLMGPKLDLQIAQLFFDPASGRFLAATNPYMGLLRDHGYVALATCISAVATAVATKMLRRPQVIPGRMVLFLVSTLALAPGLLVNVVLKDHWHRPRPVHITEFGGNRAYVDWWNPRGTCERNCSFVSGEVASAAWMFAPAMLAPAPWRIAAFAGAAIFTLVISLSRMAAGAHFFTDVLFAALLTTILIWLVHGAIFRWRRTPATAA